MSSDSYVGTKTRFMLALVLAHQFQLVSVTKNVLVLVLVAQLWDMYVYTSIYTYKHTYICLCIYVRVWLYTIHNITSIHIIIYTCIFWQHWVKSLSYWVRSHTVVSLLSINATTRQSFEGKQILTHIHSEVPRQSVKH